jgi:ABC-type nitrate/sulfonate/bicarbonate transport system ATPase subunit
LAEFKSVCKSFGESIVINDFSLKLEKGLKYAVMGESGSGKTTLLRIAAGLTAPDSGSFDHSGQIAVMFQEARLLPWKNALDNVRAVLAKEHFHLADKYLSEVGLDDAKDKLPRELSGGMAQRVSFARLLAYAEATSADLLLLDEPFSALDDGTAEKMISLLRKFSQDKTVLLVTHDESDSEKFADHVIRL